MKASDLKATISVEPIWLPYLFEKCHTLGCVRPGTNCVADDPHFPRPMLCDACLSDRQTREQQGQQQ